MHRNTRTRLSWFPFYVDDFLGGVLDLSCEERGQYLSLLLAQWSSKDAQKIPCEVERLTRICGGSTPSTRVLEKFDGVVVGDVKYIQNSRLAAEWARAKAEYEGKVKGGKRPRKQQDTSKDTTPDSVPNHNHNHSSTDTTYLPTARARGDGEAFNRAEAQTKEHTRALQLQLGKLLTTLAEHENSRLMVPAWCKKVSAYKTPKGQVIKGVSDFRMLDSPERLALCIEDGLSWLEQLNQGKVVNR